MQQSVEPSEQKKQPSCGVKITQGIAQLVFLLFVFNASYSYANYQILDKIVAIAEDEVVLASELRDKLKLVKTNAARRNSPLPPESVLYEQLMESLILDKLQLQRAYEIGLRISCLLYTSPSPRDRNVSRMPSSA